MAFVSVLLFGLGGLFWFGELFKKGWPEFWLEKPDCCAFWSGLLLLPPLPLLLPSSWPSAAFRPPALSSVAAPGRPPKMVITCDPCRVTVVVLPPAVTVMLLPKMKSEVVCFSVADMTAMPPRMPMVLEGVLMVMGLLLLILPP